MIGIWSWLQVKDLLLDQLRKDAADLQTQGQVSEAALTELRSQHAQAAADAKTLQVS